MVFRAWKISQLWILRPFLLVKQPFLCQITLLLLLQPHSFLWILNLLFHHYIMSPSLNHLQLRSTTITTCYGIAKFSPLSKATILVTILITLPKHHHGMRRLKMHYKIKSLRSSFYGSSKISWFFYDSWPPWANQSLLLWLSAFSHGRFGRISKPILLLTPRLGFNNWRLSFATHLKVPNQSLNICFESKYWWILWSPLVALFLNQSTLEWFSVAFPPNMMLLSYPSPRMWNRSQWWRSRIIFWHRKLALSKPLKNWILLRFKLMSRSATILCLLEICLELWILRHCNHLLVIWLRRLWWLV